MKLCYAYLTIVILVLHILHCRAATLYVSMDGTNPVFPYSSWNTAATNIQDAVDAANSGDQVLVTNGVYQSGGRIVYGSLTNRLVIGKPIVVQSVNGPAVTSIQGNPIMGDSAVRCVYLTNAAALSGFTLINGATRAGGDGYREQCGGAVWCESANAFITNCILTTNSAASCGGAAFRGTLNNCSVTGNIAYGAGGGGFSNVLNNCAVSYNLATTAANNPSGSTSGGGLEGCVALNCVIAGNITHSDNYGDDAGGGADNSQLSSCMISNNWAHGEGGGAANSTLQNCTLLGNRADGNGGGGASASALLNCLIVSNSAYWGAGLNNGSATNCVLQQNISDAQGGGTTGSSLYNCLITGNSGSVGGGAAANPSGTGATLVNCTVYGNSATYSSGGIDSCTAENSIIVANSSTNQPVSGNWNGGTLNYCCTTPPPGAGTGNITNDPLFLDPIGDNFHLQSNSPCIDAGNNAYITNLLDLDGNLRLLNGTVDMGAYEFHWVSSPVISIQADHTNVVVGFPVNFFGASTGGRSDSWNFGDGNVISNQWSVTHAWSSVGDYAVTLTLFDDDYPGGVSTNFIVHVIPPPIVYVNANGANPVAPYSSWGTAATNIQAAIDISDAGYHILVTNGVYQAGGKVTSDGTTNRVAVTNPVTVLSVNGPAVTLIDGGHTMRCVYLTNGAVLAGFTLTNGIAGNGGGLYCASTNALISNCTLVNNTATSGGGAYSGTLTNCNLSGNTCPITGGNGGGAAGSTLFNCTLSGNVTGRPYPNTTGASWGGGASGGLLFNCALSGNSSYGAGSHGAGASGATLNNCALVNNYTDDSGGGAYNSTLNSCLLTGNYGVVGGGATEGTLNNCTIVGNRSAGNGGGGTYYLTANNCIIVNNTAPNNLSSTLNYCCTPDGGLGCITNAPLFVNQSGGDYHLQTYSPCINAGSNAYVATTLDLDGNPRIVGATVDCGAYENQSATADAGLPTVPTALTAVRSGASALLNWPAATRATGYAVYRATAIGGPFAKIAPGVSSTNYNDSTIASGGTYIYFVTALNAYGETVGSPLAIVYYVDHFAFAPIGPQTSSVPFTVTVSACDSGGLVLSNFTGAAGLSAAGDRGNVPLTPTVTAAFANGQWVGTVTLDPAYPDTNVRLAASSNSVAGLSNPFNVVAPAIQVFNLTLNDIVYVPAARRIYATVPASAATYSNCLLVIDPVIGRVETNWFIGNDPGCLALSPDGQSLYIGFGGTNAFARYNLATRTIDLEPYLGYDSQYYWLAEHASHFSVLPGQPHSVAVVEQANGLNTKVQIFDDDVPRANALAGILNDFPGTSAAASPTRLYAGSPFTRMMVDASGVVSHDNPSAPLGNGETLKWQGGLLFTAGGNVFNPETLAVLGTLTNCSIVTPDLASGRILAMGSHPVFGQPDAWTLYSWNATNLQLIASLPIPGVNPGGPTTLIRWGTNGAAFFISSWYQNQFFLVRIPLVLSVPPVVTGGSSQAPGPFQLNFIGDEYMPYGVWASTNLVDWTPLGPPNLVSNGWFWFWDSNTANYPQRFYRTAISQ